MSARRALLPTAVLLVLGGCVAATAQVRGASMEVWSGTVREQLARYPLMQAEDLYKLAHQATFGPAHLVKDEAAARTYLQEELAGVVADASEPLLEKLSEKPELLRVNLRPFKAARQDPEVLLAALVSTANTMRGDSHLMAVRLAEACRVLEELGRSEDASRLRNLAQEHVSEGYPAIHHSRAYTDAYHPAYRVVERSVLPPDFGAQPLL